VLASGTAEEMRTSTRDDVRQFIQGQINGPVPFHYPADDYLVDLSGKAQPNKDGHP